MFAKTALFCALFAASAQITVAQQPACLIAAVNKFAQPADQQTICCQDASQAKQYINDVCSSSVQSDALSAFKTACEQAGYGSCSSSASSSSSGSTSVTSSALSSSAPYPIVYTSTHYDTECSCTKTKIISSTGVPGSAVFATGTAPLATGTFVATGAGTGARSGSTPAATGSPIAPVAPASTFKGAATKNVGSVAAGLLAVAGIAVIL